MFQSQKWLDQTAWGFQTFRFCRTFSSKNWKLVGRVIIIVDLKLCHSFPVMIPLFELRKILCPNCSCHLHLLKIASFVVLVCVDWWRKVHLKAFCRWGSLQFVPMADWLYRFFYIDSSFLRRLALIFKNFNGEFPFCLFC